MKRSDIKKRIAEEVQSGLRGFIESVLGQADHLHNGDIRINKWTVQRWRKVMKSTHFKLPPQQKVWANQIAEEIMKAITNMKKKELKTSEDPRVPMLLGEFKAYCKNIRGFEPELNYGRDKKMLKEKLAKYSEDKILDCFDWYLAHPKLQDKSPTISMALCAHNFNLFLTERG